MPDLVADAVSSLLKAAAAGGGGGRHKKKPRDQQSQSQNSDFNSKHPRGRAGTSRGGQFVQKGASGGKVSEIQSVVGAKTDGQFGDKTKAAVMAFQKKHGLTQDGIVGHATAMALAGKKATKADEGALQAGDLAGINRKKRRHKSADGVQSAPMSEFLADHVQKAISTVNAGRVTLIAETGDDVEKASADLSALQDDELLAARDLFTTLNDAKGVKAVKDELDSRTSSTAAAEQNPQQWLANQTTADLVTMYQTAEQAGAQKALKLIKKELDRRGVDPNAEQQDQAPTDGADTNAAPAPAQPATSLA